MFGAIGFALLFGILRLNTKTATSIGAVIGAALGVWFAIVVIRGWDNPSTGRGDYEQADEDRWLRP